LFRQYLFFYPFHSTTNRQWQQRYCQWGLNRIFSNLP
jgi:hypothetical protein